MDWQKLRHEWKTAALAVATTALGIWDAGASAFDWSVIVPEQYQRYEPLVLGMLFLILRRWTTR